MQGHRHGAWGKDAEEGAVGQEERWTQLWDWGNQRPKRKHQAVDAREIEGTNDFPGVIRECKFYSFGNGHTKI